MKLKAYIAIQNFNPIALEILKSIFDVYLHKSSKRPTHEELKEIVKDYDVLIIGIKEKLTEEIYKNSKKLKIIGTLSIGVEHINQAFFKDPSIRIINTPCSNVSSVAEHTLSLMLAIQKRLLMTHKATINMLEREDIVLPYELLNKTIGIIGAGKIALRVIKILKCF